MKEKEPSVRWFNLRGDKEALADVRQTIAEIKKLLEDEEYSFTTFGICYVFPTRTLKFPLLIQNRADNDNKKSNSGWGSNDNSNNNNNSGWGSNDKVNISKK